MWQGVNEYVVNHIWIVSGFEQNEVARQDLTDQKINQMNEKMRFLMLGLFLAFYSEPIQPMHT